MKWPFLVTVHSHPRVFQGYSDVFAAVIETPTWGFGFRIHTWGLRVLFCRWHLCIGSIREKS